jgi:hypothetical protein
MNTMARRLDRAEADIRARVNEFWDQFNNEELEYIINGDPDIFEKIERLGGHEISALQDAISSPKERTEIEQIIKELNAQDMK